VFPVPHVTLPAIIPTQVVRALLEAGANPCGADHFGGSAASEACRAGRPDILEALRARGARADACAACGGRH
jgi:ankyrin repeat protein